MSLTISKTSRGFSVAQFNDKYGNICSIQKSSAASEDCIWIGIDKPKLTVFENESMGKYIVTTMPDTFRVDSRMHLNQEQVSALLPMLTKFVETGEI